MLTAVNEWTEDGEIIGVEIDCETEPDLSSDEWEDWHGEHYDMPYVHWLPYEIRATSWLNKQYRYDGEQLATAADEERLKDTGFDSRRMH